MKSFITLTPGLFAVVLLTTSACSMKNGVASKTAPSSKIASVTIKHPELREKMDGPATVADKDALMKSLAFRVSMKAKNCDASVNPENKNFDEKLVTEQSIDATYKVLKGCDYIVTMVYRDQSKKVDVLTSGDGTINLTKDQLAKPDPIAVVTLYATDVGKKFWESTGAIPTGSGDPTPPSDPMGQISVDKLPACMLTEVTNADDGIRCLDSFRRHVLAIAKDIPASVGSTWKASFAMILNEEMTVPAADPITEFCILFNRYNSRLTTAGSQTCQPQTCTPAEKTFAHDYSSILMGNLQLRGDEIATLKSCKS